MGGKHMVIKTQLCRFSGHKIYPGRGILMIQSDGQMCMFSNSKSKRLYTNKKKPAKIAWTVDSRRSRKKDQTEISIHKKKRTFAKSLIRPYAAPHWRLSTKNVMKV